MICPNQWCKIKLHDTKLMLAGKELFVDHSYEPQDHVPVTGEVLVVPTLKFDPNRHEWESTCEIKVGDKVWINYLAVLLALGRSYDIAQENPQPLYDEEGIFVKYSDLYMSEDKMLNGYVLLEPVKQKLPETCLEIPDRLHHLKSRIIGKVLKTGSKNLRYNDPIWVDSDVEEGDHIVFQEYANQKIEHELYVKRDLRVVQRRFIEAIVNLDSVGVMV